MIQNQPTNIEASSVRLPWWTWIATLTIIHAGTEISLLFKYDQGVADYYLPTALSIVLINWWGPLRVLPMMYLNATLSTYLWGIPDERWYQWFVYAIPETLFTFLSWYLFRVLFGGKYWLPDIRNTVLFLIFGILVPIIPEIYSLQMLLVWFGDQGMEMFWLHSTRNFLGEFTSSFGFALPALYYLSPIMQKAGLVENTSEQFPNPPRLRNRLLIELGIIFTLIISLVFLIEFEKFWYIYGIVSLYTAIRFGFGPATLTNYFSIDLCFAEVLQNPGLSSIFFIRRCHRHISRRKSLVSFCSTDW